MAFATERGSREALDEAVGVLQAAKGAWIAVRPRERIELLERMIQSFAALGPTWVTLEVSSKGAEDDPHSWGFEWMAGPFAILRTMRRLQRSLAGVEARGAPAIPGPVFARPGGQTVARVFPRDTCDRFLLLGHTMEVWMEPGVSPEDLPATQALAYRGERRPGAVVAVLGGGNLSGIGPTDALERLFVENEVVLLKMNPLNDHLGPLIEEGFRPLVEGGFLRVVCGGAEEGGYLCDHPGVDAIHLTGSSETYNAVVFGPGEEGARRKAERRPALDRRITAELGNVGPALVVPGRWTDGDLDYQAELLAADLCENAGFTCSATRVILTHAGWEQRAALLDRLRRVLSRVPPRVAYYPGAQERYRAFLAAHPEAEPLGPAPEGCLPWTLIPGLDPRRADDLCFTTEAFCPIVAEAPLEALTAADFVGRAVEFANAGLWGTLGALILCHPESLRDPAVDAAVEGAVADLRYGLVGINTPVGVAWVEGSAPWGGFPGSDPYDVQSGTGVVHNSFMFSRVQKTVVRAPFRVRPRPLWFPSRALAFGRVAPKLAAFEASPAWWRLPGLLWSAL